MTRAPDSPNPYSGRPYRRETAAMKADPRNHYCIICGGWIDATLPHNDPGEWTREHLVPLVEGGALRGGRNSAGAHRSCNSAGGARIAQRRREPVRTLHSRDW